LWLNLLKCGYPQIIVAEARNTTDARNVSPEPRCSDTPHRSFDQGETQMRSRLLRLPTSQITYVVYALIVLTSVSLVTSFNAEPRTWAAGEVPIAFWSWRTQSPSQSDIADTIEKTNATKVFLRAGQIDYRDGKLQRIRPLSGPFPQGIELHLVYNATRNFLDQLETVDPKTLATTFVNAYQEDFERAKKDSANVRGLQLDIDVPTRLLPHYEKTLLSLRAKIVAGTQLSITGLPTWMESSKLDQVLQQVDFWIPQFYGSEIPERSDQLIPISSPQSLTHFVKRARQWDRPFYAGLSAYSVAMLYGPSGALISLRGDMDTPGIASDPNLELIDRRQFEKATGEWRYVFRARADGVTDDLAMHAGDLLVVDLPSTESLRTAARIVREQAGEKLLGICVFRLPARDDQATLTADQVHAALADRDANAAVDVRIRREQTNYAFEFKNAGTASAILGTPQIDLTVNPGSFEAVKFETNIAFETLCTGAKSPPKPCSQRRANLIRLTPKTLNAGQVLKGTLVLNRQLPPTVPVSISMSTDAGDKYSIDREVSVEGGVSQ
jgi:Protein of unknown function (DUF3142)